MLNKIHPKYRKFVGRRYHYPSGCFWLVQEVYEELYKIQLPDYTENGDMNNREARSATFLESLSRDWVKVGEPSESDIVIINVFGKPQHMGVIVTNGYMLHSFDGRDSGIESYKDIKYFSRIEGFYRYAGNQHLSPEKET